MKEGIKENREKSELDWWWLEVVEGEIQLEELKDVGLLLERSANGRAQYEKWKSVKGHIKASDPIPEMLWNEADIKRFTNRLMARLDEGQLSKKQAPASPKNGSIPNP